MARNHVWKFLVNQAGEPIEDANIYIYKAGAEIPVWVYYDEFSAGGSRTSPQTSSLENGYFEFWIDELEDFDVCNYVEDDENATSYPFNQKFKIYWEKPGIASGFVDYIDVFPPNRYFEPADFGNCENDSVRLDDKMNKLVSNYLVCRWNSHVDSDITDQPFEPIHGLDRLNTELPNDTFNKIITNNQGWLWDVHENTNVWEYSQSPSAGMIGGKMYEKSPHDLHPVNLLDIGGDEVFNKVVSNQMMAEVFRLIDLTKAGVFTIDETLGVGVDVEWSFIGDRYEAAVQHNLDIPYPDVKCWGYVDVSTTVVPDMRWMLIKEADVELVDNNIIRVSIANDPFQMKVRVTT